MSTHLSYVCHSARYRNMHTFLKSTYQVDIVWRVQIPARQKAKSSHFSLIRVKEQPQNGALCPRNSHIKVSSPAPTCTFLSDVTLLWKLFSELVVRESTEISLSTIVSLRSRTQKEAARVARWKAYLTLSCAGWRASKRKIQWVTLNVERTPPKNRESHETRVVPTTTAPQKGEETKEGWQWAR